VADSLMEDLAKSDIRITPALVTGRRISLADLPSNWWG
jgi:hypothetical protein